MFTQFLKHIFIGLLLLSTTTLVADELLIVVAKNSEITTINKQQLEHIFNRKSRINALGERWVPINLGIGNPLRIAFTKRLFKQRPEDMESYWNIQYFKGITPPYVVSSEEAILRFIATTPNAIGYINPCHLDSRVRVLMKLAIQEKIQHLCEVSIQD